MTNKTISTVPEKLKAAIFKQTGISVPMKEAMRLSNNINTKMIEGEEGFIHRKTGVPVKYLGTETLYNKNREEFEINYFEIPVTMLEAISQQLMIKEQQEIMKKLADSYDDKIVQFNIRETKTSVKKEVQRLASAEGMTTGELLEKMVKLYKEQNRVELSC